MCHVKNQMNVLLVILSSSVWGTPKISQSRDHDYKVAGSIVFRRLAATLWVGRWENVLRYLSGGIHRPRAVKDIKRIF